MALIVYCRLLRGRARCFQHKSWLSHHLKVHVEALLLEIANATFRLSRVIRLSKISTVKWCRDCCYTGFTYGCRLCRNWRRQLPFLSWFGLENMPYIYHDIYAIFILNSSPLFSNSGSEILPGTQPELPSTTGWFRHILCCLAIMTCISHLQLVDDRHGERSYVDRQYTLQYYWTLLY